MTTEAVKKERLYKCKLCKNKFPLSLLVQKGGLNYCPECIEIIKKKSRDSRMVAEKNTNLDCETKQEKNQGNKEFIGDKGETDNVTILSPEDTGKFICCKCKKEFLRKNGHTRDGLHIFCKECYIEEEGDKSVGSKINDLLYELGRGNKYYMSNYNQQINLILTRRTDITREDILTALCFAHRETDFSRLKPENGIKYLIEAYLPLVLQHNEEKELIDYIPTKVIKEAFLQESDNIVIGNQKDEYYFNKQRDSLYGKLIDLTNLSDDLEDWEDFRGVRKKDEK